jgi:hypothetical protein
MGKRESYEPGTFCWVDLTTTDPAGAKAFYTSLFGWEAEDVPAGEAGTYTLLRLDGDEVCGLYEMDAGSRQGGVPPHWLSHVRVEDADAVASSTGGLRSSRTHRAPRSWPGRRWRTAVRAGSTTPAA